MSDPDKTPKKVKIGVIGAGSWAVANHIPVLHRRHDVELVGVARPGRQELMQVQSAFGFTHAYETYEELLDKVAMDGVIIASPHHLHAEQANAALQKGCHVMVEKPMATNVADAEMLIATAARMKRQILVPYGWNFQPYFKAARKMVEEGLVGRIRHVSAQIATPIEDLMTGGALQGTENEMFRPQKDTWARPDTGGYGWGQLIHMLGGLFYLTDLEPESVFAALGRSAIGTDIHNALTVTFHGGATGALSGAASLPPGSPFQLDIRIFVTEGMLLLDVERERLWLRRLDGQDSDVAIESGAGAYSCVAPVEAFIELCHGNSTENCGDALAGLRPVQVVAAMIQSHEVGMPVFIERH